MIEARRRQGSQVSAETRCYISGPPPEARMLLGAVRGQWDIENLLPDLQGQRPSRPPCRAWSSLSSPSLSDSMNNLLKIPAKAAPPNVAAM